jgi:hypothetical protein
MESCEFAGEAQILIVQFALLCSLLTGDSWMQTKCAVILCFLVLNIVSAASLFMSVKAANWKNVTAFAGPGNQVTTPEFHINGSEWRITWTYTPNVGVPDLTVFSFFIYRHGETTPVDYLSKNGATETSGAFYMHEGPRLYSLQIITSTPGYTITVEYDADSAVSDSLLYAIVAAAIAIPTVIIVVMAVLVRKKYGKQKTMMASSPPPPPPPPQVHLAPSQQAQVFLGRLQPTHRPLMLMRYSVLACATSLSAAYSQSASTRACDEV